MRRGSGYTGATQHRGGWDDNDASDYSQDDGVQPPSTRYNCPSYNEPYGTSTTYTRAPSREKPSGIPRPGGHSLRPPSAMKAPRNRSYSSSSSADSRTTNEGVPPVPQIPHTRGRSATSEIRDASYNAGTDYPHNRPQSGLSRRSSVSRSRSSSHSRSDHRSTEDPPPLPGSNSDSDGAGVTEQTPKRASWAKDRRRFANTTPTSTTDILTNGGSDLLPVGDTGSRYDQLPIPAIAGRRSSLKPPSNFRNSITPTAIAPPIPSRIPSVSTKSTGEAPKSQQSLEHDVGSRNSSRTKPPIAKNSANPTSSNVEDRKAPQVVTRREPSQVRTSYASRITDTSRSEPVKPLSVGSNSTTGTTTRPRNRQSSVYPKVDPDEAQGQSKPVVISSMHDAQLPVSPFAQPNAATGNRTPQQHGTGRADPPETISSPVETMLIGSAPTAQASKTPTSRRMSTPIRPTRESSVYVPPTPAASLTPSARRLSEPSPNKGTPSTKAQPPMEQESPPTIFQRLARRASFSTGKSPKATNTPKSPKTSSTPKSRLDLDRDAEESPFDLELETPRATTSIGKSAGTKSTASNAHQDLSDRQRNRQSSIYQSTVYPGSAGNELRKPRSKVVEDVSEGSKERLGSPFMGDGSPRFGIDERFRSPKKRTKSGLRHDTFESNDDRSQELLEYYGHGIVEPANTANYYIEGLPIGTVLSSPESTPVDQTPKGMMPSSPMAQSKKRSQYQYTSRTRPSAGGSGTKQKNSGDLANALNDDSDGCTPIARRRSRSPSAPPLPIITRTSVTSLDSSTRSDFSDFSDQESDDRECLKANVHHEGDGSGKDHSGRITPTCVRFASQLTQHEPEEQASRTSKLPIPRQRKTNSALFRALEQPYDSSSSATVASLSSSSVTGDANSSANTNSGYATTGASMEGLHAVSSISSSLDGNGVGSIRWSGGQELSGAAEALFHNIERSHSGHGFEPIAMDSNDESLSSIIDGSTYDMDEIDDGNYDSTRSLAPRNPDGQQQCGYGKQKRMSMQDKRKAIHESWRASLEEGQFQQLEKTYDPMEMRRQELIWEFHESERAFVDTLRILVHLFVQPLRTQDQRRWIAGLSADVMRLFDWLDDITNLHEQLLDTLDTMRQDHEQVIILFSESIQPFIPLIELYQPYIVRVEETSKQIASMALDLRSDFGEFVRMQSALPECEVGLDEMIRRPLLRLREYVSFFQALLTLTPRTHPDHLSCFSLFHSMHAMMCVLDEVKAREEEYELVKSLLGRVRGLPSQFSVATRENRLLAQGPLTRVYVHGDDQSGERATSASRQYGAFTAGRSRTRSGSQSTTTSSTTDSTSSYRSTASSVACLKDSSTEYSMRSDSSATSGIITPHDGCRNSKPAVTTTARTVSSRTFGYRPRIPISKQSEEIRIYALIFTDYIILAKAVAENRQSRSPWPHSNEQWTTLEALGVFRLLGIIDYHGRYGYEYLISLDLIPISDTGLNDVDSPMFVNIPWTPGTQGDAQDFQKTCQQWFRSLQQCYLHTLRTVSFPLQSEDIPSKMDRPGSRLSVEDRFPKSPSQQIERETRRKEARLPPIGSAEGEREERRFWAERFKVISNEMRRVYDGISRPAAPEAPATTPSQPSRIGRFRSSGTFI